MAASWIVSANASRARFFAQPDGSMNLEEINDMVNEAARLDMVDTETDKLGPTSGTKSIHNTGGPTPNKLYEPAQTPDQRAAEFFAKDIASFLSEAHREGNFDHLSIVASPKFLGVLRKELDPQVKASVDVEIDKDYTSFNGQQLREQIKANQEKS
jgi:protein required for attachment to host cells